MEELNWMGELDDIMARPPSLLTDPWQPKPALRDNSTREMTDHLPQERESLAHQQVVQLQRKLWEKEEEAAKLTRDFHATTKLVEDLKRQVREKDDIIAELQQTITSLEVNNCQQQQQQQQTRQKQHHHGQFQKKNSFPKISMPKLSLSRSSSSPDVDSRSSPGSGRRYRAVHKSESSHTRDRLSPSPLSPLLELSAHPKMSEGCLLYNESEEEEDLIDSDVFVAVATGDASVSSSGATNGGDSPRVASRNDTSSCSDSTSSGVGGASSSPADPAGVSGVTTVDISDLRWREGKRAPDKISRGSLAVRGNTAYLRPSSSHKVYSCTLTSGKVHWSTLTDGKFQNFGLVVVGNHLVSVGGQTLSGDYGTTSELLSLSLSPRKKHWVKMLPPMPTSRCNPAVVAVASQQTVVATILVVAGGYDKGRELDCVEVLDTSRNYWSSVSRLPERLSNMVGVVYDGELFLAGGFGGRASKSVFASSLAHFSRCYADNDNGGGFGDEERGGDFWRRIEDIPVTNSTIAVFRGSLVAVGGACDFTDTPTNHVYRWSRETGRWGEVCVMRHKRERCFVAGLTSSGEEGEERRLVVVGGVSVSGGKMDHVEVADIPSFAL